MHVSVTAISVSTFFPFPPYVYTSTCLEFRHFACTSRCPTRLCLHHHVLADCVRLKSYFLSFTIFTNLPIHNVPIGFLYPQFLIPQTFSPRCLESATVPLQSDISLAINLFQQQNEEIPSLRPPHCTHIRTKQFQNALRKFTRRPAISTNAL